MYFLLNNTEIYPIYIDATPEELELFNTDPNKTFEGVNFVEE